MKNSQFKKSRGLLNIAFFGLFSNGIVHAVTIPKVPMVVDTGEPPNLMMIADTSGSMKNIVVDAPYNENINYGTCSSGNEVSTSETIELTVANDGTAQFNSRKCTKYKNNGKCKKWVNANVSWANATGQCFKPDDTYEARLVHNESSWLKDGFSGNYLNWYFSNAVDNGGVASGPDNFGSGVTKKPEAPNRNEVMKSVMVDLFNNTITNANVGIASFTKVSTNNSSTYHGQIDKGLLDIDAGTNRADLISTAESLIAYYSTPLASALAQVGRYYVEGENASLAISSPHASGSNNAYELFEHEPIYVNSSDRPTNGQPVTSACQGNYIIALTDGEPTKDIQYTDDLAKWDDNSTDSSSNFDDVAAALYDLDLRPDLVGTQQNVTTHVIGFALDNALLQDTADAGGGSFTSAIDSASLSTAFNSIFAEIQAQVGSIASVAFNSSQLDTGSTLFQAMYDTGSWSGTLTALPLDNVGAIGSETWEAGDVLDTITPANRKIFTFDSTANAGSGEGIPFEWGSLNASQKADLYQGIDYDGDGNSPGDNSVNDDDDAQALLDYIRGDQTNEGSGANQYRTRASRLGDIVNSTPLYIGKPAMNWPDHNYNSLFGSSSNLYSSYKNSSSVQGRKPIVYVGSNDGMLHGFNGSISGTSKGEELFSYIPGAVFSANSKEGLHYLAEQDYSHHFYVDLSPVASDVYIKRAAAGSKDWRTVLVGGLRAGGRGLFALDVSNPTEFSNPSNNADDIVLWEFSSADDGDLGYSYSKPSIAMMANGKWAVILGNGYESDNGTAKLFILYLEEGIDGWIATDYVKLDTGASGTSGNKNGLSSPQLVDLDSDSVVDVIYAGDLQGNMWAFDVSNASASNWSTRKLFTATDGSGNAQPITTAPLAAINPNDATPSTAAAPNLLIMFGAGKYLESTDSSTTDTMTYYSVWDKGTNNLSRTNLESREVVTSSNTRTVNGSAIDWSTQYGWRMDLLDITSAGGTATQEGERVVSDSLLRRTVLFFNTMILDTSTQACASSGGGWLMSLDFDSGLAPSFAVFDANGDGTIDSSDIGSVGSRYTHGLPSKSGILGEKQYTPGTDGEIDTREINVGSGNNEGRFSWSERVRN